MKEDLIKKRKELMDRVDAIKADYRRGLDADSEERASQLANRETLQEIERVSLEEIARIDEQLKALKQVPFSTAPAFGKHKVRS